MAERRMFTGKITESDAFLEMPLSTQALYFHLCMNADDDGFVKNPKRITKMVGANDDDLKLLMAKRFVIYYDITGVIVIKHWRMHNLLRKDRYKETEYIEEKATLFLKENGAYTLDADKGIPLSETPGNQMATAWQPSGNQLAPQDRLGKDSIGEDINTSSKKPKQERNIIPPTLEMVQAYCKSRGNNIDAQAFIDFYDSKGWVIGKSKMKDWQATIRTWERSDRRTLKKPMQQMMTNSMDMSDLEKRLLAN